MAKAASVTVSYKGRPYMLLWSGPTKFGARAKLAFLDGSKEFWVPMDALGAAAPPPVRGRRSSGPDAPVPGCSKCRALGRMCRDCAFDEYDS